MVVSLSFLEIKNINKFFFLIVGDFFKHFYNQFHSIIWQLKLFTNINGNLNQRTKQLPVPKVFYHLSSKKYKT